MMRKPSTCLVEEPLRVALKRMATMQIAQLVVVNDDNRLIGLFCAAATSSGRCSGKTRHEHAACLVVLILAARIGGELATRARSVSDAGRDCRGTVLGPTALNLITPNETLEFLGHLGILFMTFLAGYGDGPTQCCERLRGQACLFRFWASCFVALGFGAGWLFDFGVASSLFLGARAVDESLAVNAPPESSRTSN